MPPEAAQPLPSERLNEPIAIIGIGCRFPGGVHDLESYWQLLRDGIDAIQEIPRSRFDLDAFYDPRPATPGKVMSRFGGFLDQIEAMDAAFFGISPREAESIDPQQRLLMEVAWEALENAGLPLDRLLGSQTGVFVGQWLSDFEARLFADPTKTDFYMTTGSGRYAASGRLSYLFGLQGPSLTLDTACSSSLVAVHTACQSLRTGESDMALAAAVNVILQPNITVAYSQSKMMAPDGHCKFGDARANGYVRSEGAAALVLKRLSDAQRDGDPIHALIIGSAVNNDGQSSGFLTTPGGEGQEEMLRKAYRSARVSPAHIQYVEAHGTGTAAGDPVEIGALGAVLGEDRPADRPCYIGSVKTNFGHTEGAAGLAGLIKVVLALKHAQIPPSLHFQTPSPAIPWDRLPLRVNDRLSAWPEHDGAALAGVSAFGITGTNAHIVLQETPQQPEKAPRSAELPGQILLPLSARSSQALQTLAGRFAELLSQHPELNLADVLYTASQRRSHHSHRLVAASADRAGLIAVLNDYAHGSPQSNIHTGQAEADRKVVLVFPGQGAQWLGMGRQLYENEPTFRASIERCEQALRPFVDWSLTGQLFAGEADTRLAEIDVVQPVLFAIEIALAETWRAWGIQPDAVVGHSMGEPAAAYIAGALSLEDAARVICTRSRLMKRVSGKGAMAVVELSIAEAQTALAGLEDRLSIAVSNGPRATVISGDPVALENVTARLQEQNVFVRAVKVDVAAHSPHMDALRPELVKALADIQPRTPTIPIYSTVTGALADFPLDAGYWGRNLRQPVLFATAVEALAADGHTIFVECSPHPTLLAAIEQGSDEDNARVTVPSMRRGEDEFEQLRAGLSRVYTRGDSVRWDYLYPQGNVIELPAYPWQRERFWPEAASEKLAIAGAVPVIKEAHPLLHDRVDLPVQGGFFWQTTLKPHEFPALFEHRLNGTALLAASTSVELALAATRRVWPDQPFVLADLLFQRALALSLDETQPDSLLVSLTPSDSGALAFELYSRQSEAWQPHVSARIQPPVSPAEDLSEIQMKMQSTAPAPDFYAALHAKNIQIGEDLQAVSQWWQKDGKILARLTPDAQIGFLIAPALLDAGFQLLGMLTSALRDDIYMPSKAEQILPGNLDAQPAWVYAALREPLDPDAPLADLHWMAEDGTSVLQVSGLQLKSIAANAKSSENPADWLYKIAWQPMEPAHTPAAQFSGDWLILLDQNGLGEALAQQIEQQGARCIRVCADQIAELRAVLQQTIGSGNLQGVIHLWSLDLPAADPASAAELQRAQAPTCASALTVIQELSKLNQHTPPRLWLMTRAAQSVLPADIVQAVQAPLWGLGRVIAEEQPEFFGGLVDLPAAPTADAVSALVDVLAQPKMGGQLAWRAGQWHAPRLHRLPATPNAAARAPFAANAAYLITGGLGGIGLELARWMALHGARRLILMGRTPLPPRTAWSAEHSPRIRQMITEVGQLEALGVTIHYAAVDVADETQLSAFLDAYHSEHWPPIRGVFHAAGVIEDRMLTQLDDAALEQVLRPKMIGGWLLHKLLKDQPLDFFVLFSSYGALVGQAGQGNYAAANAFLDALAHARRAQGLPALSINWGAWSGLGFATTPGGKRLLEKLALQGLPGFNAAQGLAALDLLLGQSAAQVLVARVDWGRLQASGLAQAHIWQSLLQQQPATKPLMEKQQSVPEKLRSLPIGEQRSFLQTHIQKILAQVLRLSPERITPKTPLGSLGLESLMSVEFRNRLEASLDLKLSATLVWSYPTLHDLTNFLIEKLGITASVEAAAPPRETQSPAADQAEVLQKVKAMSDEDALLALKNRRKTR